MYMISYTISCILSMISDTDIVYDIIAPTVLGTPEMSAKFHDIPHDIIVFI